MEREVSIIRKFNMDSRQTCGWSILYYFTLQVCYPLINIILNFSRRPSQYLSYDLDKLATSKTCSNHMYTV